MFSKNHHTSTCLLGIVKALSRGKRAISLLQSVISQYMRSLQWGHCLSFFLLLTSEIKAKVWNKEHTITRTLNVIKELMYMRCPLIRLLFEVKLVSESSGI